MSNALEDRGHELSDDLWTARLLRDEPAEIVAVHRAYFEAGADVATTASYQASIPGLVRAGLSERGRGRTDPEQRPPAREAAEASPRRPGASSWSLPRSGHTVPRWRTAPSTAAGTASPRPPCATSTRPGSSCWPRRGRTCWRSRPSRTSTRPRSWCRCWTSSACRRGSRTPSAATRRARASRSRGLRGARREHGGRRRRGQLLARPPTSSPPSRRRSRSRGSQGSPTPTAARRGTLARTRGRGRGRSTSRSLPPGWKRGHAWSAAVARSDPRTSPRLATTLLR